MKRLKEDVFIINNIDYTCACTPEFKRDVLSILSGWQTTKERHMWTCPFHPPIQLYFIIRNTERSPDFGISRIKIWNYNRSLNVCASFLNFCFIDFMCHYSSYIKSQVVQSIPFCSHLLISPSSSKIVYFHVLINPSRQCVVTITLGLTVLAWLH